MYMVDCGGGGRWRKGGVSDGVRNVAGDGEGDGVNDVFALWCYVCVLDCSPCQCTDVDDCT